MKLHTVTVCLALIIGLTSIVSAPVLANGGGDSQQTVSYNPLVLIVIGIAVLVVAYLLYRILRGR